jgi:hypothetical protein
VSKVTYPLSFALELSSDGRAFFIVDTDYSCEVDTARQKIWTSFHQFRDAVDMRGESFPAYVGMLQCVGVPINPGWLPVMERLEVQS